MTLQFAIASFVCSRYVATFQPATSWPSPSWSPFVSGLKGSTVLVAMLAAPAMQQVPIAKRYEPFTARPSTMPSTPESFVGGSVSVQLPSASWPHHPFRFRSSLQAPASQIARRAAAAARPDPIMPQSRRSPTRPSQEARVNGPASGEAVRAPTSGPTPSTHPASPRASATVATLPALRRPVPVPRAAPGQTWVPRCSAG